MPFHSRTIAQIPNAKNRLIARRRRIVDLLLCLILPIRRQIPVNQKQTRKRVLSNTIILPGQKKKTKTCGYLK
jgi:hypothetical protein